MPGYLKAIGAVRAYDQGNCVVDWVTPAVSVCLATRAVRRPNPNAPQFSANARGYAQVIGLGDALAGSPAQFSPSGLAGRTYSPLAHLRTHAEIEPCNETINSLFRSLLGGHACVGDLCKVVGELHDNVASHARGIGFSAAQQYGGWLEFAIADAGCGLRSNAAKVASIADDAAAIVWALGRGNTSAGRAVGFWEQRWEPGRSSAADFGGPDENHHQGLGLALLVDLVTSVSGSLWIASGNAQRVMTDGVWAPCTPCPIFWDGVAIELAFPILKPDSQRAVHSPEPDDLAKELGL